MAPRMLVPSIWVIYKRGQRTEGIVTSNMKKGHDFTAVFSEINSKKGSIRRVKFLFD